MNANFGIVLRKSIVEMLLLPLAPVVHFWGDKVVEIGEKKFTFPLLEKIEFQLYPVTEFVKNHLPVQLRCQELEYAWMVGSMLDEYEEWVWNSDMTTSEMHPFEKGLFELIRQACGAAIMFAPEGERLGEFVNVEPSSAIALLRLSVKNIDESNGFLAIVF